MQKLRAQGAFGAKRAFFGKTEDKNSVVDLKDGQGRTRLALHVTADGMASIQFLDANGKVLRTLAAK
jgi:hypothetical protein